MVVLLLVWLPMLLLGQIRLLLRLVPPPRPPPPSSPSLLPLLSHYKAYTVYLFADEAKCMVYIQDWATVAFVLNHIYTGHLHRVVPWCGNRILIPWACFRLKWNKYVDTVTQVYANWPRHGIHNAVHGWLALNWTSVLHCMIGPGSLYVIEDLTSFPWPFYSGQL